jgi:acetyl-CoA C-acetyltransferase
MNKNVVIVSAVRTPIGCFLGSLASVSATDLGAIAIKGALEKINLSPSLVDEVLMGNVLQANLGQAPAKQAAIKAGIPNDVPCTTINKVCASGMKSVTQGAQAIQSGDAEIVVVGGMENMSQVPFYLDSRKSTKLGDLKAFDGILKDGLTNVYDQGPKVTIEQDEEFRKVDFQKMRSLDAAFSKEGSVTAANASKLNDGAAALVLMSSEMAFTLKLTPLATIKGYADASQEPEFFTTTPSKAIPKALAKAKVSMEDVDYFELNEAFSVVALANCKLLNIPLEKTNIRGGAVALGHPLGCSGARILVTLTHILDSMNKSIGAAGICNGGGGATAIIIEKNTTN